MVCKPSNKGQETGLQHGGYTHLYTFVVQLSCCFNFELLSLGSCGSSAS